MIGIPEVLEPLSLYQILTEAKPDYENKKTIRPLSEVHSLAAPGTLLLQGAPSAGNPPHGRGICRVEAWLARYELVGLSGFLDDEGMISRTIGTSLPSDFKEAPNFFDRALEFARLGA